MAQSAPVPSVTPGGLYPIRTVSAMTGVNPVTLRAWERRYGLIKPQRTPKGHRLYTEHDVQVVQRILELIGQGVPISRVRPLLSTPAHATASSATPISDPWFDYQTRIIEAIARFDERAADAAYNDALSLYPVEIVTRLLVLPLFHQLRERWRDQPASSAEEHFFNAYIRNKLGSRFHHQSAQANGLKLIAACLPGEHSEVELLLFSLGALTRGYRIVLLGPNMPLPPLSEAVARSGSCAIVLYGSLEPPPALIRSHLAALAREVGVPIFVGGDIAVRHRDALTMIGVHPLRADLQASIKQVDEVLTGRESATSQLT